MIQELLTSYHSPTASPFCCNIRLAAPTLKYLLETHQGQENGGDLQGG